MRKKILHSTLPIFFCAACIYLAAASYHVATTTAPDFLVYYYAARDAVTQVSPYTDPHLVTVFTYPPPTLLLLLPFTLLSPDAAQAMFVLVNAVCMLAVPFLALRFVGIRSRSWYYASAALLIFAFPTKFTLGMGQINAIAITTLLTGWLLMNRRRTIAALCIAAACLAKPVLGFTLIVLVVRRRDILRLTLAWAGAASVLGAAIIGVRLYNDYWHHIVPRLSDYAGREVYYNQGITGFVARLTEQSSIRQVISSVALILGIGLTASASVFSRSLPRQAAIAITVLLIVDPLSWQHHFMWLIVPFLLAAHASRSSRERFFIALSYLLVAVNIADPQQVWILARSHGLYGAGILLGVLLYQSIGNNAVNIRE